MKKLLWMIAKKSILAQITGMSQIVAGAVFRPFAPSPESCLLAREPFLRFNLAEMNSKKDADWCLRGKKMKQNDVFCFTSKKLRRVGVLASQFLDFFVLICPSAICSLT